MRVLPNCLYKNYRGSCSGEIMTRFVCLFLVASVLGGCAYYFYPAPPIKHTVIEYDSCCGDRPKEPRPGQTP